MMDKKTSTLISMLVVATFLVTTGLWIIDLNISLSNLNAMGVRSEIGSFLVSGIDPRIHYHLGVLAVVGGFFTSIASWQIYSVRRDEKK